MVWYVIAGIAAAAVLVLVVYSFIRDRRYLRKKTSEVFGPDLRAEIEAEREEGRARQERWRRTLSEAMKGR